MNIIQNNPYRIVGLLVGASAAQQNKHISKIPRYIEAENEIPEEFITFSFPSLGNIKLSCQSVLDASSKLQLDSDKMNAALFWFYKDNVITDEPAFDAMKEGDIKEAFTIWSKLTSNGEVTKRNASAFSNLGTLYLSGALESININYSNFNNGISYKLKFLESDYIKEFKKIATDETFKTTKNELQLLFLNEVQSEIEKNGKIPTNKFIEIITKLDFLAKDDFLKSFVQKPLEEIEKKIREAKNKQKENPAKSGEYGLELYNSTSSYLTLIINILGKNDIRIISISDKIAQEILNCGITLFNHFHETATEVGEIALELNKLAESIALGALVKDKIRDSIPIVERYVKEKPIRQKINKVRNELEYIRNRIEQFKQQDDTLVNVKRFLDDCSNKLSLIMYNLGHEDQVYINISSGVVLNAQGTLIRSINQSQSQIRYKEDLINFRHLLSDAIKITNTIGLFHMEEELHDQYQENKNNLIQIEQNIFSKTASTFEKLGRSFGKFFN